MVKHYDILTGNEIAEGEEYVSPIKPMCLNCVSCMQEYESYSCNNEKVMEAGKKKIMAAVPEGYEIDTLTLKPMVLKNPTKKCPNYKVHDELVISELMSNFK